MGTDPPVQPTQRAGERGIIATYVRGMIIDQPFFMIDIAEAEGEMGEYLIGLLIVMLLLLSVSSASASAVCGIFVFLLVFLFLGGGGWWLVC